MSRFLLIVLLWAVAPVAKADRLVIAEPWFPMAATDGREIGREVSAVVREELSQSHQVVAVDPSVLPPKPCDGGDCGELWKKAADAVGVVVIRVGRAAGGRGPATSFQLGLQLAVGVEFNDGAVLTDGPLRDIVLKALREVMRQYALGVGPWLEVRGSPKGGKIFVDDRLVSTMPGKFTVSTGSHRVRVEATGFEPITRVVSLMSPTERRTLEFRLEPARAALVANGMGATPSVTTRVEEPRGAQQDARRRRVALVTAGGVLAALGAVFTTVGIIHKVRTGDCVDGTSCEEVNEFGAASKFWLGSGVSLLTVGGGLIVLGETKFRITPSVDKMAFGLALRGAL